MFRFVREALACSELLLVFSASPTVAIILTTKQHYCCLFASVPLLLQGHIHCSTTPRSVAWH